MINNLFNSELLINYKAIGKDVIILFQWNIP